MKRGRIRDKGRRKVGLKDIRNKKDTDKGKTRRKKEKQGKRQVETRFRRKANGSRTEKKNVGRDGR